MKTHVIWFSVISEVGCLHDAVSSSNTRFNFRIFIFAIRNAIIMYLSVLYTSENKMSQRATEMPNYFKLLNLP